MTCPYREKPSSSPPRSAFLEFCGVECACVPDVLLFVYTLLLCLVKAVGGPFLPDALALPASF